MLRGAWNSVFFSIYHSSSSDTTRQPKDNNVVEKKITNIIHFIYHRFFFHIFFEKFPINHITILYFFLLFSHRLKTIMHLTSYYAIYVA